MKTNFPVLAALGLFGSTQATFAQTRDSNTLSTAKFPLYGANPFVPTGANDALLATSAASITDNTVGGYACVRSGLIFAHPQLLNLANTVGLPITSGGLRTFYGTTTAHIGIKSTPFNFGCCRRLQYTATSTECPSVIDITTTSPGEQGMVFNNRAYYKGPNAVADSGVLTGKTNVVVWNSDFLLAAQW